MNDEETVNPPVDAVESMENNAPVMEQEISEEQQEDESQIVNETHKQVPLSALQKERKKRQELEQELQWERRRQQMPVQQPVEEDNSKYESATREDLSKSQNEAIRIIEEKMWIKNNPEKYEKVNEDLPQFLKQRPNLASAINSSTNRYEEAYTLMEALTPKQHKEMKKVSIPRKDAPGSPSGVPKSASLNQAVDVMSMNDSEFNSWRQSQKRRR